MAITFDNYPGKVINKVLSRSPAGWLTFSKTELAAKAVKEIKALPVAEKLQIVEVIWQDFRTQFESREIPRPSKALLDKRRARVRAGAAVLLDWDSEKSTIGTP